LPKRLWVVALLYTAVTIVMTWPVAAGIDRDVPSDLGDPAFVTGVIAWGSDHWLALLSGDLQAPSRFWNAPIFHPEPLTLAYSEHFALHSLLTLPAYALTRNPVLCYNLSFLSTFVIGALGMYLLVRDLTGPRDAFNPAAFVAGLAFAFAPYRIPTLPHLQILSSHWMPFVLLGLHRYARARAASPDSTLASNALTGAGAAWWAQNLSSGYYMLYFTPFVALYALVVVALTGIWRRVVVWRELAVAAAVSFAATLPFAVPYLERTRGTRRAVTEIAMYSADLASWMTASPLMNVWGDLQTFVKPEGALFPGVTVVVLALIGIFAGWRTSRPAVVFSVLALVLSFWLTLGLEIRLYTQPINFPSLYQWLLPLPGFSAARVPARFATIAVLSLALLAGLALARANSGRGRWVIALCGALILAEGSAFPLPINGTWTSAPGQIFPPPSRLYRLDEAPAVFRYLATLPDSVAIAHFPFGLAEREIQYGYYAMLHGRRTINGYSGAYPPTYAVRTGVLSYPFADLQMVQTTLSLDTVTHVVVHTGAYGRGRGMEVVEQFEKLGWQRSARFDEDVVLTR
jgi:hypothetical protein